MYALFLSTISKFKESPYDDMDKNRQDHLASALVYVI